MHIAYQRFWLPKSGNSDQEYEDAFWPSEDLDSAFDKFPTSIADGATETSFARLWAGLLTKAYAEGAFEENLDDALPTLRNKWSESVQSVPLSWYAEEKAHSGAFSSLVGLTLFSVSDSATNMGRWEALAIGDSCLFQMRGGRLIAAFPLDKPEQFNNRPLLLSSVSSTGDVPVAFSYDQGEWQVDDIFFLMTDALACWFLQELGNGNDSWKILIDLNISSSTSFADLVTKLRSDHSMRNDDVTLLRVNVD